MTATPVRVRFAPSPTGTPHVGNIRTALFTWLLARHSGGTMILRIEDTDRARFIPGSYGAIVDALRWLGIDWDEGPDLGGPYAPYVQSERLHLYHDAVARLIAQGDAYYCFCTVERLAEMRAAQIAARKPTGYDRRCRNLDKDEVRARLAADEPAVVRFAIPLTGTTVVQDALRGAIKFDNAKLDDHVLLKSDGFPTYQLAATLDDELMQITHVLRGDEWISSFPRQELLHRAMGVESPVYAQLPLITGSDRKKLSKRNGDTAVSDFRDLGYLPDALLNFLGTLGWSLDDHTTLISREQFIEHFDLDRIGTSPAMWDMKRLNAMNGEYIRDLSDEELMRQVVDELERGLPPEVPRPVDREIVALALPELRKRLQRLGQAVGLTEYLFPQVQVVYDREALLGKRFADDPAKAREILAVVRERLDTLDFADHEGNELKAAAEEMGVKFGDLMTAARVAITGRTVSLPLIQTMEIIGREESALRLDRAIAMLSE